MKVFQIGHGYMPNSGMGVIEYLYQVSNQLVKEGVEVVFIQFDGQAEDCVVEPIDGITLMHFPTYTWLGLKLPVSFEQWLDQLTHEKCDFIFHLHSVFFLPNFSIAKALRARKIPYIHTPHDSYTEESLRKNKLLKKAYIKAFDQYVMDGAKTVHAITSGGAASIAKYTRNPNIRLITNFVPPSPRLTRGHLQKQICFIGRMDIYQKGIDLMLEAFFLFRKSHRDVRFVLMGPYLDSEIEEFTKLCTKYQFTDSQVKLMGKGSVEEKYRILNESYVYFQLSRFEGFGLSIVEALSVGKPVIISAQVPVSTEIQNYQAGFVAETQEQALSSLHQIFGLSKADYRNLSENAYSCYQQQFNPERITRQLIEMYAESLGIKDSVVEALL